MRASAGVIASPKLAARDEWLEPIRDGATKHRRFIWLKRGGTTSQNGSGPTGWKMTPAHRLARSLAERPGVSLVVKARETARVAEKAKPPVVIQGLLGASR